MSYHNPGFISETWFYGLFQKQKYSPTSALYKGLSECYCLLSNPHKTNESPAYFADR
jgi:hypothetical protein